MKTEANMHDCSGRKSCIYHGILINLNKFVNKIFDKRPVKYYFGKTIYKIMMNKNTTQSASRSKTCFYGERKFAFIKRVKN